MSAEHVINRLGRGEPVASAEMDGLPEPWAEAARVMLGANGAGRWVAFADWAKARPDGASLIGTVWAADHDAEPQEADKPPRFKLYSAADALAPQPPVKYVIDRLLPEGSVSLLVGEAGSKKTYAALDALVCVASDKKDWLGLPTTQGAVLIVDEESGHRRISRRVGAVLRGHFAGETTPIYYTSLARFDARQPGDVAALHALIVETNARLVVLDALADIMPGADENAVKDVQPIFMALRDLAEATGAAIVVIHHANKLGGYRGSSAMKGAVDLMLLVESKPGSTDISFACEKLRDCEPFKFSAVIHFDADSVWLTTSESSESSEKPLSKSQGYVMRYLVQNGDSPLTDIESHADTCSPASARRAVYELADRGKIGRVDAGGSGERAIYGMIQVASKKWTCTTCATPP